MPSSNDSQAGVESLLALGIPRQKAVYALKEHGNEVEAAADWCLTEGLDWTPQQLLSTYHQPVARDDLSQQQYEIGSGLVDSIPLSSSTSTQSVQRMSEPLRGQQSNVPAHRQIRPGVSVSIVLKQDQPTGKRTGGVVQQVLTRGDHPRGVKVRLVDGRVGRVQELL
ncbi:hypothetical protein ACM66B_004904 [Microbotryomycetes sp. NB124-2]